MVVVVVVLHRDPGAPASIYPSKALDLLEKHPRNLSRFPLSRLPFLKRNQDVVMFVCFLPIYSGRQVCWTYQPGSHRTKVTQDFLSTFLVRCMP